MRVLVCGGRDYKDREVLFRTLSNIDAYEYHIDTIIEGGARGADMLAREWAIENRRGYITVEADWDRFGRQAGPVRNQQMLVQTRPELVVAFPGGKGTADMVERAKKAGLEVIEAY